MPKYESESPRPSPKPKPIVEPFDKACPECSRRAESSPSVTEQREFNVEIKRVVEAILFAANRPMTCKQVQQVFPEIEQPDMAEIQAAVESIQEDYRLRPIELKQVASGYRFQVRKELSRWVSRLFEEKPPKYSRALLETLAIIAYRQPATRGDIEDIRGVGVSSSIVHTLLEREWIRVVAHKEVPGRPALYGTTKQFLDYFNITSLDELPTLQELQVLDVSLDSPSSDNQLLETQQQPMQVKSEDQETIEQQETTDDCKEAGGRATQGAVAEQSAKTVEQAAETIARFSATSH